MPVPTPQPAFQDHTFLVARMPVRRQARPGRKAQKVGHHPAVLAQHFQVDAVEQRLPQPVARIEGEVAGIGVGDALHQAAPDGAGLCRQLAGGRAGRTGGGESMARLRRIRPVGLQAPARYQGAGPAARTRIQASRRAVCRRILPTDPPPPEPRMPSTHFDLVSHWHIAAPVDRVWAALS